MKSEVHYQPYFKDPLLIYRIYAPLSCSVHNNKHAVEQLAFSHNYSIVESIHIVECSNMLLNCFE